MAAKRHEQLIYSAVGLVALFLVLVAVNFLISRVPARVDLTEGHLYTLSPGTKKILAGLASPVKLKLYISQGEAVPVPLRSFAQRVEDMAREFKSVAGPNLVIELYNPKPDSEDEDSAQLDGVEPQQIYTGEQFYLGAVVSQLDRKQVIPALSDRSLRTPRLPLADALRAVSLAASDRTGGVKLSVAPNTLRITSESPESGNGFDEMPVDYTGPELTIGFNAKYFLDVLGALDEDEVELGLGGELDPAVVRPVGERQFLAVVMPMRI